MIDSADEEAFKRLIFWDEIDKTVSSSVAQYAQYARAVVLPQFKGSDEERSNLKQAIDGLEPSITTLMDRLSILKDQRPVIYKSALQELHIILSAYATIGGSHAFTEVVERAALQPVKEQRSKAGKKSAVLRAASLTDPWHKLFDPIAKRLRGERPDIRNADLIREARKAYPTKGPTLPKSDRQLSTHLNDLVNAGELLAGPKDGRGRRDKK